MFVHRLIRSIGFLCFTGESLWCFDSVFFSRLTGKLSVPGLFCSLVSRGTVFAGALACAVFVALLLRVRSRPS